MRKLLRAKRSPNILCPRRHAVKAVRGPVQLALRVSSISVTVITPGAGCSITSAATVSTTGAIGCFIRRAAFFTGAGLGLAVATVGFVAFAALDALRALPRVAEFPRRSFARFCTFDAFFRLAMIYPPVLGGAPHNTLMRDHQIPATGPASYQQIAV